MTSASPTPTLTPFGSVSQLLVWMAERAAPLAAVVLGIAALYWSDFRREFALPVGFASSSMLTALPSLAAIVCIVVGALVAGVAMPALVLTHPLRPGAPTLAALLRTPVDTNTGERQNVRASRMIERYWLGMAAASALTWAGVISWMTLCSGTYPGYGVTVLMAVIALQTVAAGPVLRHALQTPSPASISFYLLLFVSLIFQCVIAFWVMYVLLKTIVAFTAWSLATRGTVFIVLMVIAAIMQLVVAMQVTKGWYPNLLKHVLCLGLLILGATGMVPPIAARLSSYALLSTATPGRTCTIVRLTHGSTDASIAPLLESPGAVRSKPLNVVYPDDTTLYVKETMDGPTYLIDAKRVAGTEACKDEPTPP
ncbi:hypothetical protein FIV34_11625 [Luteibacter pinisoli]|uniref:Uncharacterized protein n=1 Tax=Luteibacter pinisoli TaxID=2589080 RepID=A0A4Y5Z351_9GAMM|nr:hypothetical protein [Luteibacter pinisoli]QDE39810.1 hypothetical protein FIV34_11625 [Luteibacter pinisoli]